MLMGRSEEGKFLLLMICNQGILLSNHRSHITSDEIGRLSQS
jgi:hypothetical protein